MCSRCRMDGKDVARRYLRQGAVDVEDFEDEVPYRHAPRKKKKVKEKTRPGCPGNDYKAHVYVWTTENQEPDFFSDYYGFPKYQRKVCAGCGKSNGSMLSDEYQKIKDRKWEKLNEPEKGVPISRFGRSRRGYVVYRYWSWENYDEDYRAARNEYIDRNGWPSYLYTIF